ncbi:MAG: hypothetical protein ABF291_08465 [Desulfobacterales bacterium]
MNDTISSSKVGVYIDAENMRLNGGFGMQYDVLREFTCRDGAEAVRLNVYVAYDEERAAKDSKYKYKINEFFFVLREYGYKINRKIVKVVRALQNRGCRVEIVAFQNVSKELRYEADMFMPGYLIPNLFPIKQPRGKNWGDTGSIVVGRCYHYDQQRGRGYMRYITRISGGLWITDARNPNSPYRTAYFTKSDLPEGTAPYDLPDRNLIFQFKLAEQIEGGSAHAMDLKLLAEL